MPRSTRSRAPWRRHEALAGYGFLLPNFLGFLAFVSLPVLFSLTLSCFEWDILTEPRFAGLGNYRKLLWDAKFWHYLYNTVFLMLAIPLQMAASLGLAVLLDKKLRGVVFFRTLYFLPSITAGVAIYLLWMWIYNPSFGLVNYALSWLRITGPKWLEDPAWSKPALVIMTLWAQMGGVNMILYLAALQNIPPELYEAADVDGVGAWQRFRHITFPLLGPTTFFILTTSLIRGFQGGFEMAYIMTQGGPAGSTTTVSYYLFQNAFEWGYMGYASSIAWVLFALVFVVTMINWRWGGKKIHY
jgi:multiple sugar transport system permease protein